MTIASITFAAPAPPLDISNTGAFKLAGLRCQIVHFVPSWEASNAAEAVRADAGYPKRNAGDFEVRGEFPVRPSGS